MGDPNELVERVAKERDRHVIGYPSPRRDVAELLDHTHAALKAAREALELLLRRIDPILDQLGPGGYLVPAGAVLTNNLEAARNEARTALSLDTNKGDGV